MASVLMSAGSAFALGLGAVAFVHGFRSLRLQRLIRDTPTAKVRSLAMGLVELQGLVKSRSRARGPFSDRDCVWWEVELQTMSKSNKGGRTWHTVHRERSGHPFYVDDGTGTALVYPQGADVRAGDVVSEETHGFGVPEPYAGYMQSRELGMRHLWAMGPMRFRERRLEEGRTVYVLGRAEPRPRAVEVSMDDEDVLEATGTDAIGARHVREHDGRCSAVVRKGRRDPALLISDHSEKSMTVEYGLKAFGGLVGGPLLAMFGLWCLMELARSGDLPLPR
jgi:E3 ubiquitin ligase